MLVHLDIISDIGPYLVEPLAIKIYRSTHFVVLCDPV